MVAVVVVVVVNYKFTKKSSGEKFLKSVKI